MISYINAPLGTICRYRTHRYHFETSHFKTNMNQPQEKDDLDELAAESMVDLAYTYKTFFKMAERAYNISKWMDLFTIVAAVGLFDSLLRQTLPEIVNLYLAAGIAIFAVFERVLNFNERANRYEQTGDSYNSLYKDFREFRRVTLPNDDIPFKEKRQTLDHLIERQQELNELTPTTSDRIYSKLDEEDVLGEIEVTEDEQQRI